MIVIFLFIWVINSEWFDIFKSGNAEDIKDYLNGRLLLTLTITFLLMSIQNLFTIIPKVLVVTVNVWIFDFYGGFGWSWVTSVIGSTIAFLLYRYWFQGFVKEKVNAAILEKIEKSGFHYVFYARLIPVFPTSLINLTAGASSIRLSRFIGATALGNLIFIFIMCLIVEGILSAEMEVLLSVAVILVLFTAAYFYRRLKKGKETMKV